MKYDINRLMKSMKSFFHHNILFISDVQETVDIASSY